MKLRIRYGSWLVPPGYKAWVLFPFMFFRHEKENVTDTLFRHEMQHVYQVLREGWILFYIKYLWYSWRRGYRENPFEVEANAWENEPLTDIERAFKLGGKKLRP